MPYKIYTKQNLADTSRDPDDIRIEELGYKNKIEDALKIANAYIQKEFFRSDTKLIKTKNVYTATDFCSYGKTIIIEEIKID